MFHVKHFGLRMGVGISHTNLPGAPRIEYGWIEV